MEHCEKKQVARKMGVLAGELADARVETTCSGMTGMVSTLMAFLKLYRRKKRKPTHGNQGSPFNSSQTSTSMPGQPHSGEASSLLVVHLA